MSGFFSSLCYWYKLPWRIQWRTALVQLPRWVPLSILHFTSREGPHPFIISLPSRKDAMIPIYVFIPPAPVDHGDHSGETPGAEDEWKVPVVLDFHGGGFIMGSPLEQAPYAAMMSRELGAVVISVSYRIGPFHQFPAAIHDAEDVLSAILDTEQVSKASKVLREEINRFHDIGEENRKTKKAKKREMDKKQGKRTDTQNSGASFERKRKIVLDPTRLCISGFSAGGNIALNMAISVPPCDNLLNPIPGDESEQPSGKKAARKTSLFSPLLPPARNPTIVDDPKLSWPSVLPPPQAQPRMLPLLLFYPSLDARLLPHERPMKALPAALKGDDHQPQKPKVPGLFSIMSPTYLPKKLRNHPRASPGLVNPDDVQKNTAIFLVLPENDSLAVQSDVWVDKMRTSGWNGPVRFGDGRLGDWDGKEVGPRVAESVEAQAPNGGLEVWHAPKCRHGWTQFPKPAQKQHEKRETELVFARTLDFVKESWRKKLPVEKLGSRSQEMRPLRIPSNFGGLPG